MFVSHETRLDAGFAAAQARLVNLAQGGSLFTVAEGTYGEAITRLARVGPLGSARGMSRLVTVEFFDWTGDESAAILPLRWQTAGPGGKLFPALDANLTLTRARDEVTRLRLDGVYRPPLGTPGARLDELILRRLAVATVRNFVNRVATAIVHPASAAEPAWDDGYPEGETT